MRSGQFTREMGHRPPRTTFYVGAFFLLAAAIMATGYFTYAGVRDALREEKQADLAAIATLKTNQIAAWVAERGEDARLMAADSENATGFEHWLAQGAPENGDRRRLLAHLVSTAKTSEYRTFSCSIRREMSACIPATITPYWTKPTGNWRLRSSKQARPECLSCTGMLLTNRASPPACPLPPHWS